MILFMTYFVYLHWALHPKKEKKQNVFSKQHLYVFRMDKFIVITRNFNIQNDNSLFMIFLYM